MPRDFHEPLAIKKIIKNVFNGRKIRDDLKLSRMAPRGYLIVDGMLISKLH